LYYKFFNNATPNLKLLLYAVFCIKNCRNQPENMANPALPATF
jgi:hypothetical protein